jgi:hypothetical protein
MTEPDEEKTNVTTTTTTNWEDVPAPPSCHMYGRIWTDEELDAYVEREYGITKEDEERLFKELKEWALEKPELQGLPCDDKMLIMFLR